MTTVIFMGTPKFSVPILKGIIDHGYQVLGVVTQPDHKIKGVVSESAVKKFALYNGLTIFQPKILKQSDELLKIEELHPDLIITAAYGQFLPLSLLKSVKIAAINVHGSLLPKYRGGSPVQYALKNNDDKTGITIMYMVSKMDAGDIIAQKELKIQTDDNSETLFNKLSIIGRDLLIDYLPSIINKTAKSVKQDESKVTYAYNLKSNEEHININWSAEKINGLVRALYPNPGAYLNLCGVRTKILKINIMNLKSNYEPGIVVFKNKKKLVVSAGNGTSFEILSLKPSGKKIQSIVEYLNGHGRNIRIGDKIIID